MRRTLVAALAAFALITATAPARAADPNDPAFMWDLTDLYPSTAAWTTEAAAAEQAASSRTTRPRQLGPEQILPLEDKDF